MSSLTAVPDDIIFSAYSALRSYQYGNTSEELAKEIADQLEKFVARRLS